MKIDQTILENVATDREVYQFVDFRNKVLSKVTSDLKRCMTIYYHLCMDEEYMDSIFTKYLKDIGEESLLKDAKSPIGAIESFLKKIGKIYTRNHIALAYLRSDTPQIVVSRCTCIVHDKSTGKSSNKKGIVDPFVYLNQVSHFYFKVIIGMFDGKGLDYRHQETMNLYAKTDAMFRQVLHSDIFA